MRTGIVRQDSKARANSSEANTHQFPVDHIHPLSCKSNHSKMGLMPSVPGCWAEANES